MKVTSLLSGAALLTSLAFSQSAFSSENPLGGQCPNEVSELSPYRAYGFSEPAKVSELAMRGSGIVHDILVDQGDRITKSTPLLTLIASGEEESLEVASKRLAMLKERYASSLKLKEKQHIAALDLMELEVEVAQAKKELDDAVRAVEDLTLMAPFDGKVEKLNIEIGEHISAGQSAMRLVDTKNQKVVAEVYSGGSFASCLREDNCFAMVNIDDAIEGPFPIDFVTPVTSSRKGIFQAGFYMNRNNAAGLPVDVYFVPKEICKSND